MSLLLTKQVYSLLRELKIAASPKYLEKLLVSHTDYPSLLCITDTLDELGIENASLVVDKEKLNEIPVPFLAHLNERRKEFVLVTDVAKTDTVFKEKWDGIIVAAEKSESWKHEENEKWLQKEKEQRYKKISAGILLALLILTGLTLNFSWSHLGIILTSLAGCGITVLIVQQELGISNSLTEQLCGVNEHNDCHAVIHSKGAKLFKGFDWADAGLIYFSSLSLLHLLAIATPDPLIDSTAALFSAAAVPVTIYSVYYQWRIIKKWCRLCLAVIALLWIQAIIYWPQIVSWNLTAGSISQWLPVLLISNIIASTWLLWIKPAVKRRQENREQFYLLTRFKNSPAIFMSLLKEQRHIDANPIRGDIQIGNPRAAIQFMVVCNPYCGPCAKMHMVMHQWLQTNDIGLRVRFTIGKAQEGDIKTITVKHILNHLALHPASSDYSRQVLHDWYTWSDYEKFKTVYPVNQPVDVSEAMNALGNWMKQVNIKFTPTLFINGFELPSQYKITDIAALIKGLAGEPMQAKPVMQDEYTPV